MEVKKRAPDVLRVAGTSLRTVDRAIRTKKGCLKKGLTASVIGAEEEEDETKDKSDSPFERNRLARRRIRGGNVSKQTVQERYRQNQKEQAEIGKYMEKQKGYEEDIKRKPGTKSSSGLDNRCISKNFQRENQGNGGSNSGIFQPFKIKSVSETLTAQKIEKKSKEERERVALAAPKGVGKRAGRVAGNAATAATRATVTATTGAMTGGTSVAIEAAVRTVTGAIRKTKEALQASVIQEEEKQSGKPSGGMIGILIAGIISCLIPLVMTLTLLLPIVFIGSVFQIQELNGANRIVLIARQEANDAEENIGGQKYKDWYRLDADWCAIFVSWCGDQCGYLNSDIMPRTASVDVMKNWYEDKKLYHTKESGYEPKMGDIIFFGNGASHVGIVSEYNAEDGVVRTIEGNTGRSVTTPYHAGSRVKENWYPTTYKQIIGYATPEYPLEVIEIPEPYGTEYSYMGWQMITSKNSKQYKLREEAGMNFDEDGFGKINDRYVIACTTTFGQVGDYIDWELDNGTVIKTVIGDIKNQNDEGCNEWGHRNGLCVIEFVVDKGSWYGKGKYPTDFHSEWDGRTVRATKVGSFW